MLPGEIRTGRFRDEGRPVRTSWGSATDSGRVRPLNEDAVLAHSPVFLVADGMGGHDAGDVASRVVVDEFSRFTDRETVTADDVHQCFREAARRLRVDLPGITAGTTVAGVALTRHLGGPYWLVFNIGDSRVYRLVAGELEQISVDHSVVQELVERGSISPGQMRVHPERHVITRALDTQTEPEPDYWLIPVAAGDRVLVCTDGLTTELDDTAIASLLGADPDPQAAARRLVDEAVDAGGTDNVSVVVIDVGAGSAEQDGTEASTVSWDSGLEDTTRPRSTGTGVPAVPGASPADAATDGSEVSR